MLKTVSVDCSTGAKEANSHRQHLTVDSCSICKGWRLPDKQKERAVSCLLKAMQLRAKALARVWAAVVWRRTVHLPERCRHSEILRPPGSIPVPASAQHCAILFNIVNIISWKKVTVESGEPVQHDVRLWSVNGVVHPAPRLLNPETAPFRLRSRGCPFENRNVKVE